MTTATSDRAAEMAKGLRDLADVIERNGGKTLPLPSMILCSVDATVFENKAGYGTVDQDATKRKLLAAIRAMGRGRKDKDFNDYEVKVTKKFSGNVRLIVTTSRGAVCRKVPTGRVVVHEASVITLERREEEEYEWVCDDPLLSPPAEKLDVAAV